MCCLSCKRIAATTVLLLPSAQRQMLLKGTMNVLPSFVSEYWTAMGLPSYTCRLIRPVDSRFRSVRVSMRCEMIRSLRRNWPWRCGPPFSAYMIFTVHLPTKIVGTRFDPSLVFSIHPSIHCMLLWQTQAGTRVYLLDGNWPKNKSDRLDRESAPDRDRRGNPRDGCRRRLVRGRRTATRARAARDAVLGSKRLIRYADVGGLKLRYVTMGSGPTLVLLHTL